MTQTKADWLRSEIEKLEGEMKPRITDDMISNIPFGAQIQEQYVGINQALTSIITRYKEELLELEKGV